MDPSEPATLPMFVTAALKRRVSLAIFVGVVGLAAAGVSIVLPSWFRAQATLLPPQESGEVPASIAGMIQSSALSRIGLVSNATPSDVFKEILESRTLHDSLAHRFDLERRYRRKGMERTLKEFSHHLSVVVRSSGVLVVQVEDHNPRVAADMTNYLVVQLDRFNRETYNTRAKRTREFLERRLVDTEQHMRESAQLLSNYERLHGVLAEDQSTAARGAGDAISRKMTLQIERDYVSSYARPDSPELRELDASLAAVQQELSKLPPVKQEGTRLAMDAEIQRRVFTLLTEQYEAARVQEQRDTPTITVLDAATPPEIKSRPRRSVVVLTSMFSALILAVTWAGFGEARSRRA